MMGVEVQLVLGRLIYWLIDYLDAWSASINQSTVPDDWSNRYFSDLDFLEHFFHFSTSLNQWRTAALISSLFFGIRLTFTLLNSVVTKMRRFCFANRIFCAIPPTPAHYSYSDRSLATGKLSAEWNFDSVKADFLCRTKTLPGVNLSAFSSRKSSKSPTTPDEKDVDPAPNYATFVPLCVFQGTPCMLFTLRSSNLYKHRGEISFPGGKSDPTDANLIDTALRETEEEIGLPRSRIDVWTTLPAMPTRNKEGKIYLGLIVPLWSFS